MLREYLVLKNPNKELLDGAEFWKETGLGNKLKNFEKYLIRGHAPLKDILEFLNGEVYGIYQSLNVGIKIRLAITEAFDHN